MSINENAGSLVDKQRGDDAIDYPEHLARDHRTAGEEKTQQEWKAEHPLAHRAF